MNLARQHKKRYRQKFNPLQTFCGWALLIVLLLQPLTPAFASEDVAEPTPPEPEVVVAEVEPSEVVDEVPAEAATAVEPTDEIIEEIPVDETEGSAEDESNTEVVESDSPTDDQATSSNEVAVDDSTTSEEDVAEDVSTTTETYSEPDTATSTTQESSNATSTPELPLIGPTTTVPVATSTDTTTEQPESSSNNSSSEDSSTASSTEEEVATSDTEERVIVITNTPQQEETQDADVTTSTPPVNPADLVPRNTQAVAFNSDNKYTFTATECVSVGDGSFYCTEANPVGALYATDRVFAAQDDDGDKEIYVELDGEIIPITVNDVDDDAPYFDETTNTILWHRLVDDRYQIIIYDLDTGTEEQLTSGRENNMEPTRYGETIVWQSWIGGDWDIVMQRDGERTILTDNDTHDITPNINGDHIIWQSYTGTHWQVRVFDRRTETIDVIEDSEGGSVENPRFVLVYDTKYENGDVETKGYDIKSGQVVPLSSQGAPTPVNIPDPEQTGEERALVSPTVQIKSKSNATTTKNTNESNDTTDIDMTISSSTEPVDVIVTPYVEYPATTTEAVQAEAETHRATSTTPFEIVVEPVLESEETLEEGEDDSQLPVATST